MKKNILLIVGSSIADNELFYRYLLRSVYQSIDWLDEIITIDSNKFLQTIKPLLNDGNNLVIATTPNTFATVSKVLSTVTGDNLELKSNMLIPKETKVYENDSYLLEIGKTVINVIKARELEVLPPILLEAKDKSVLHIFELDRESVEILLEPLTKSFEIELNFVHLTRGWLKVICKSKKHGEMNHFIKSAKKLFEGKVIDSKNIFKYLINRLDQNEKTITFAESCTGGLIAASFTAQSGTSRILMGSSITYSNEIKNSWLGVEEELFEKYGAVSEECVAQMLEGAVSIAGADFALAVSGIAGPGGATEYKPVGTVVIGVRNADKAISVKEFHFKGDRNYVQQQALYSAVKMLILSDKSIFL